MGCSEALASFLSRCRPEGEIPLRIDLAKVGFIVYISNAGELDHTRKSSIILTLWPGFSHPIIETACKVSLMLGLGAVKTREPYTAIRDITHFMLKVDDHSVSHVLSPLYCFKYTDKSVSSFTS